MVKAGLSNSIQQLACPVWRYVAQEFQGQVNAIRVYPADLTASGIGQFVDCPIKRLPRLLRDMEGNESPYLRSGNCHF